MPVRVSVRGRLTQPVAGTVTRTANALDPGTRTLLVEVDIPNPSHELLPGMFVYVGFTIAPAGTRWRVPATAVVFDAQGHASRHRRRRATRCIFSRWCSAAISATRSTCKPDCAAANDREAADGVVAGGTGGATASCPRRLAVSVRCHARALSPPVGSSRSGAAARRPAARSARSTRVRRSSSLLPSSRRRRRENRRRRSRESGGDCIEIRRSTT